MSTEQEIRAAFDHGNSVVSTEAAEKFAEQMRARGLDPSAALAKHGVAASQPATPGDQALPKPTQYTPDIDPATGLPRLTAAQVEQAADTLRKHWTGDPAALEAALARAGAKPLAPTAPDDRSEEEREFDASALAPSVDGSAYELNGVWLGKNVDIATLAQTERAMRSSMAELSVPKALGRQMAEDLIAGAAKWSEVSERGPLAVQQHHANENALFARATRVSWAQAAAEMKGWLAGMSEGTRSYLASSGALESANVRVRLWQSYQLAQARAGMRKGGSK